MLWIIVFIVLLAIVGCYHFLKQKGGYLDSDSQTILKDWVIEKAKREEKDTSKIFQPYLTVSRLSNFKYECRDPRLKELLPNEVISSIETIMNSDKVFIYILHYCYGILLYKVNKNSYTNTTKNFINRTVGTCIVRSQKIYSDINFNYIQNEVSRFANLSDDINYNISLMFYHIMILPKIDIYLKDEPLLKEICLDDLYSQVFNWYLLDLMGFFDVFELYNNFMRK